MRVHAALLGQSVESRMVVLGKQSDDWRIKGPDTRFEKALNKLRQVVDRVPVELQRSTNPVIHSTAWLSGLKAKHLNSATADIINLHWICSGLLSIEEIGRISKPVVWTLHDMWGFCGAEHVSPDDQSARWRHGYTARNRNPAHSGLDIDRWVWLRKQKAWRRPFHIISPSNWLADCARNSALMHDWPVTVIPNPLDTKRFKPYPKHLAREILQLPLDSKLVLFGAIGGTKSPIKGWDLLAPALTQLAATLPNVNGVIFGQSEPQHPPALGLPLNWMGHLHDDATLALLYSAADVMVVPSRQENLPQSATEAQACGCPVVAFNATGLPDAVVHRKTGYLAEPYNSEDLSRGIKWVLSDESRHKQLCEQARNRAVRLWSSEVVLSQYLKVYHQAIKQQGKQFIKS